MRLIDADRLFESIYDNVSAPYEDSVAAKEECLREIEDAPTVDAVVVTRCKDCARYRMGVCMKVYTDGDMFSARWQERKPDDFLQLRPEKGNHSIPSPVTARGRWRRPFQSRAI